MNAPTTIDAELSAKRDQLLSLLRPLPGVAVAFSGGIDSTVVAKAAFLAIGAQAIAITADSASVPRSELEDAKRIAKLIGIRHRIVKTDEFANPDYLRNDGSRCYHCKSELYDTILELLPELAAAITPNPTRSEGIPTPSPTRSEGLIVCSGANLDDMGDFRPGLKAAAERQIRHPLQEAGFTKADVRALARDWDLPTWDKPASPCLSSRLAPGLAVTPERTFRIEHAEAYLKGLGLRDCRVRLHDGELARIEVPLSEIERFTSPEIRDALSSRFRELGFQFITLDLEGFRSGSLNTLVNLDVRRRFA